MLVPLVVLSEPALISQLCDLVCVLFAPDIQFVMCPASFRQVRHFGLSLPPIILHPPIFPGNLTDKSWLPGQECPFILCVVNPACWGGTREGQHLIDAGGFLCMYSGG